MLRQISPRDKAVRRGEERRMQVYFYIMGLHRLVLTHFNIFIYYGMNTDYFRHILIFLHNGMNTDYFWHILIFFRIMGWTRIISDTFPFFIFGFFSTFNTNNKFCFSVLSSTNNKRIAGSPRRLCMQPMLDLQDLSSWTIR